jgi:hypothetical protein
MLCGLSGASRGSWQSNSSTRSCRSGYRYIRVAIFLLRSVSSHFDEVSELVQIRGTTSSGQQGPNFPLEFHRPNHFTTFSPGQNPGDDLL